MFVKHPHELTQIKTNSELFKKHLATNTEYMSTEKLF